MIRRIAIVVLAMGAAACAAVLFFSLWRTIQVGKGGTLFAVRGGVAELTTGPTGWFAPEATGLHPPSSPLALVALPGATRGTDRRGHVWSDVWCPLWFPFVVFASYPTVAFIRGPLRRWRWRRVGGCLRCGYDLTGNTSGVCPECGTRFSRAPCSETGNDTSPPAEPGFTDEH